MHHTADTTGDSDLTMIVALGRYDYVLSVKLVNFTVTLIRKRGYLL